MDTNCFYCTKDERRDNLMIEIADLGVSTLFLFKEQTYRGRCIVALKEHYREIFEVPEQTRLAYLEDVCRVAEAVQKAFAPDKINYGAFGDTMPHVHFHIVPKYKDQYSWGTMFEMNPAPNKKLEKDEYEAIAAQLLACL